MSEAASYLIMLDSRWILALALLVLDAWSITLIVMSGASRREKWLWSGVVILCPIVGCLLWYVLGPKPLIVEAHVDEEAAGAGNPGEATGRTDEAG